MDIVTKVQLVLNQNIKKNDKTLDDALQLYHELVKNGIITPRGNQLIKDEAIYEKRSNFF